MRLGAAWKSRQHFGCSVAAEPFPTPGRVSQLRPQGQSRRGWVGRRQQDLGAWDAIEMGVKVPVCCFCCQTLIFCTSALKPGTAACTQTVPRGCSSSSQPHSGLLPRCFLHYLLFSALFFCVISLSQGTTGARTIPQPGLSPADHSSVVLAWGRPSGRSGCMGTSCSIRTCAHLPLFVPISPPLCPSPHLSGHLSCPCSHLPVHTCTPCLPVQHGRAPKMPIFGHPSVGHPGGSAHKHGPKRAQPPSLELRSPSWL